MSVQWFIDCNVNTCNVTGHTGNQISRKKLSNHFKRQSSSEQKPTSSMDNQVETANVQFDR